MVVPATAGNVARVAWPACDPAPSRTSTSTTPARHPSGGAARIAAKSQSGHAMVVGAASANAAIRQTTPNVVRRSDDPVARASNSKPRMRVKASAASRVSASAASDAGIPRARQPGPRASQPGPRARQLARERGSLAGVGEQGARRGGQKHQQQERCAEWIERQPHRRAGRPQRQSECGRGVDSRHRGQRRQDHQTGNAGAAQRHHDARREGRDDRQCQQRRDHDREQCQDHSVTVGRNSLTR